MGVEGCGVEWVYWRDIQTNIFRVSAASPGWGLTFLSFQYRRSRSCAVILKVCSSQSESGFFSLLTALWTTKAERLPRDALVNLLFDLFQHYSLLCRNFRRYETLEIVAACDTSHRKNRNWRKEKKKRNFSCDLLRVGQNLHIRKVYTVNEVPGLELRDKLSVCISVASWRNNSILNTTFYVSE